MFYSIHKKIKDRIDNYPDEAVFVPGDFKDIAEAPTASKTLRRLCKEGNLTKIMRGVFSKTPAINLSPDSVAKALARSNYWQAAPYGETALHILGLSFSKPTRWTYITDGTYRCYEYGHTIIEFRHASGKFLSKMSNNTVTLIQAIRAYGKDKINEEKMKELASKFKVEDLITILNECSNTSAWIYRTIKRILKIKENNV